MLDNSLMNYANKKSILYLLFSFTAHSQNKLEQYWYDEAQIFALQLSLL